MQCLWSVKQNLLVIQSLAAMTLSSCHGHASLGFKLLQKSDRMHYTMPAPLHTQRICFPFPSSFLSPSFSPLSSLPPSHQLEDCVRAVLGFEGFLASCPSQEPHRTNAQTTHYSEEEITCAFFVHALSIIERVLLFTDGRKLFPVSVDSAKGNVMYKMFACRNCRSIHTFDVVYAQECL